MSQQNQSIKNASTSSRYYEERKHRKSRCRNQKVYPKIDILANSAGVALLEKAEDLPEEYWDKTMELNLKGSFLMAQIIGREMIATGGGKIVNMASQASVIALDKHVAYCASKAAIVSMTQVLAMEWAPYNINVNAISPTVILTELGKKLGQVKSAKT